MGPYKPWIVEILLEDLLLVLLSLVVLSLLVLLLVVLKWWCPHNMFQDCSLHCIRHLWCKIPLHHCSFHLLQDHYYMHSSDENSKNLQCTPDQLSLCTLRCNPL